MVRVKENASQEVYELMRQVMHEHHPELEEAGVRVGILMVSDPDETCEGKPFLEIDGKRVLAFIRKRRLFENPKHGDALIEIDSYLWQQSLDDSGRNSLFDHELEHLSLLRTASGKVRKTLFNRASLKMKNHDWEVGIFNSQVERYGREGIDFLSLALVLDSVKTILNERARQEMLRVLDSIPIDSIIAEPVADSGAREDIDG